METVNKKIKHLFEILAGYLLLYFLSICCQYNQLDDLPTQHPNTFLVTAALHLLKKGSQSQWTLHWLYKQLASSFLLYFIFLIAKK